MSTKHYTFDYSEMKGPAIINIGSLSYQTQKLVSRDQLKEYTKKHLGNPNAVVLIANIERLSKAETRK